MLLNAATKFLGPSDSQAISDYLYGKGIDPTTATMGDVASITFGGGLDDYPGMPTDDENGFTTGIQGGNTIYATDQQIGDYQNQRMFEDATSYTPGTSQFNFDLNNTMSGGYNQTDDKSGISTTGGNDVFIDLTPGYDPFAPGATLFDPTPSTTDDTDGFWA
jgi:hypothetical protein